jgi:hypothetical protein|tara:strand:+ start:1105 stop:1701 length:597 start_codon:yes stop_codon:yes gene_type:complete
MGETKSTFKELTSINVRDKVEKKGRFDYLSWAYAWAIVKDKYPSANRKVYESEHTGLNFFSDGSTSYVKVGIEIEGVEHIDYLPVMGHNNQSLTMDKVTSFAVNKTIQRSTVKAIAMHGLGLSLWAGEDLADISETAPKKVTTTEKKPTLKKTHDKWNDVVNFVKANKNEPFASTISKVEQKFTLSVAIKKDLSNYAK